MPWLPELFSAPLVERIQRQAADERAVNPMPYFAGVQSGETEALLRSFAGEPELHHTIEETCSVPRPVSPSTSEAGAASSPKSASITMPTHRSGQSQGGNDELQQRL